MEIPPIPSRNQNRTQTTQSSQGSENRFEEKRPSLLEGITLKMTAKGRYYWDINAFGELNQELVLKIKEMDRYLRSEFPSNVNTLPDEE